MYYKKVSKFVASVVFYNEKFVIFVAVKKQIWQKRRN